MHEAIVNTPVHIGNQHTQQTVETMDRVTGEVTKKTINIEKPVVSVMKNVREVQSEHRTLVDMRSGNIILPNRKIEMHGNN